MSLENWLVPGFQILYPFTIYYDPIVFSIKNLSGGQLSILLQNAFSLQN